MPPSPSHLFTALIAMPLLIGGCASLDTMAITRLSPMDWNGHSRIELPMTLDSVGRPTVPARIAGEPAMVLIDSGGGWPSMTPALATAAGVRADGSTLMNGHAYATTAGLPLQLGPGSIDLHKVAIGHQTAETQFALGPELFLQAIVDMDFDAGRMTLIRPESWKPPSGESIPVQLTGSKPTVQLRVNGHAQEVCAILDTGFNSGVALSGEVLSALALPQAAGHTTLSGLGGARWNVPALAPLDRVGFSNQLYRDVPVTEKKSDVAWPCPNLLGMAVLSNHRVIFDLKNQRVWLLPRATGVVAALK
jgi:hypothetical protein